MHDGTQVSGRESRSARHVVSLFKDDCSVRADQSADSAQHSQPAQRGHVASPVPRIVIREITQRLESLRSGLNTLEREHEAGDSIEFADTLGALRDEIEDLLAMGWLQTQPR